LERTLRTPAHYRQFVGSQLAVKLRAPLEGARRFRGVLLEAGDSTIRLATDAVGDGNPGAGLDVPYSLIERARTVLQWGPAPKPRTSKRTKRSGRAGGPFAPSPKDAR
jgi:ribosome maturation factor RimP